MRPKFLATILLLAILVTGAVVFVKSRLVAPASPPTPPIVVVPPPIPSPPPPPVVLPPPVTPPPATNIVKTDEERKAAIEAEEAKLQEWQANDDSASYFNILNDLTHPERDVRFAAMEALKQFGGTNAIPVLKDLAGKTEDLDEAKALLDTAKFLSLPPADLAGFFKSRAQNAPVAAPNQ